jgi:hypothetical protein
VEGVVLTKPWHGILGLVSAVVLVAVGVYVRTVDLGRTALWYDEQSSLLGATGQTQTPALDVKTLTVEVFKTATSEPDVVGLRTGFTPAAIWQKNRLANVVRATEDFDRLNGLLFNVALHYWIPLAGLDDAALKALPLLFGLASVLATFIGLRASGAGFAGTTAATLLVALHPLLIWSSLEVRSYSLAALLLVTSSFLVVQIVQRCEDGRPASHMATFYALAVIAALLSHYLSIFVLVGHALWALLTVRHRRAWATLIIAGIFVGSAFALWFATIGADGAKIMAVHSQYWADRARLDEFTWLKTTTPERVGDNLFVGFVRYLLLQPPDAYHSIFWRLPSVANIHKVTTGWVLFFAALTFLTAVSLWKVWRYNSRHDRLKVLMLILTAVGPLAAALLAWRSGHTLSFAQRYLVLSAPFAAIFLGLCAGDLFDGRYWRKPLVFVVPIQAMLCIMAVLYLREPDRLVQGNVDPRGNLFLKAARDVATAARDGDVVVYAVPFDAIMLSLYLKDRPNLASVVEQPPPGRPAVMIRRGAQEIPIVEKLEIR